MHPFANLAYARLNLDFDRELFAKEYDEYILPASKQIAIRKPVWQGTRQLNQSWGMVDPDLYDKCNIEIEQGNSGVFSIDPREIPQFKIFNLMTLRTVDSDSDFVKKSAGEGGSLMRNHHLDRLWTLKPEFRHLKIVEFILKKLPFKKIVSIHCASLAAGTFACIHRDLRYSSGGVVMHDSNNGIGNGVYQQGHVIISLNISDGGVPLWWSLDGQDRDKVFTVNDQVYMHSDYFLHGVPVCAHRRRQIRITGIPSAKLSGIIDHDHKVVLPDDYKFDPEQDLYPG
jgi:hypothetical protein